MKATLEVLLAGRDLSFDEARAAMDGVMAGEATPAQIAAFLVALRAKGETVDEIAGCASAMREHVVATRPRRTDLVEAVGTGGDRAGTFNISTTGALVAAAAGAAVAKHGNRAITSRCGAADVLEALGIVIELPHEAVAELIDEVGFGFLFAPSHHPAMRHAGPVRRELGVPTVMNLLGPLTNPVGVRRAVIGVSRPDLVETFAHVLARARSGARDGRPRQRPGRADGRRRLPRRARGRRRRGRDRHDRPGLARPRALHASTAWPAATRRTTRASCARSSPASRARGGTPCC